MNFHSQNLLNEKSCIIRKFLCKYCLKSYNLFNQLENLLKKLTINFSAAATSQLKEKIKIEILLALKKDKNFKITAQELIDCADSVANHQNIKISDSTIPSLIKNKIECPQFEKLNKDFTGRVIIDLTREVKIIQLEFKNKQLYVFDLKIFI